MTCVNLSERKAAKGDHLPSSWGGQGVMIATEMNTWLLISFVHVCFVHMLYACLHVCEHPWVWMSVHICVYACGVWKSSIVLLPFSARQNLEMKS